MGGEKNPVFPVAARVSGSPPHGRGKAEGEYTDAGGEGITPAWAGKSRGVLSLRRVHQDHPRMGGEKPTVWRPSAGSLGSPPHGRGKVHAGDPHVMLYGITPAWAGKRGTRPGVVPLHRDHPRMGGEKGEATGMRSYRIGSPPHGRGKAPSNGQARPCQRITPAWAGKRPRLWPFCYP